MNDECTRFSLHTLTTTGEVYFVVYVWQKENPKRSSRMTIYNDVKNDSGTTSKTTILNDTKTGREEEDTG